MFEATVCLKAIDSYEYWLEMYSNAIRNSESC